MPEQPHATSPSVSVSEPARLTTGSERRQLTKVIGVRIDADTEARYAEHAERLHMTIPALMRLCTDHLLDLDDAQRTPKELP